MARCPHCDEEMDAPAGETLRLDELFDEEKVDVSTSVQQHVQLECQNCGAVLGYLGVGAATGN